MVAIVTGACPAPSFSAPAFLPPSAGDHRGEGTYVFQTHAASTISKTIDHRVKEMAKREGRDWREPRECVGVCWSVAW